MKNNIQPALGRLDSKTATDAPEPFIEPSGTKNILDISGLNVRFSGSPMVHAVNDLNLCLKTGEILTILGESGSGKSVTLKALLRLLPKKKTFISGLMRVGGVDIMRLKGKALASYRGGQVSMIFQEPGLALDPVYTIGSQIIETLRHQKGLSRAQARESALAMLEKVRIPSAKTRLDSYPHEMSGGMLQRAMIALALACEPQLLLADEPTTALDTTVQIQVLLLLRDLQKELGMSVVLVTHDIGVAVEVSDRIAVMYGGTIVEQGSVEEIIYDPRHPYTRSLLSANLRGVRHGKRLETIRGSPPSLATKPQFCTFAPRCPRAVSKCRQQLPLVLKLGERREVSCLLEGV